ncbi:hypothetical protein QBC39DRAFT_401892 [Podospora conica]|nr:hypothetical protein QBC39DRAFT_401892 [Schizothecium conicum]
MTTHIGSSIEEQPRTTIDDNEAASGAPSARRLTRARSPSIASSRNSPARTKLAREAASQILSGLSIKKGQSNTECLSPLLHPRVVQSEDHLKTNSQAEVMKDDDKKTGRSLVSRLASRVRDVGLRRRGCVRDASSWHQPLRNGSDRYGQKGKGVAPPEPLYDRPPPIGRRNSAEIFAYVDSLGPVYHTRNGGPSYRAREAGPSYYDTREGAPGPERRFDGGSSSRTRVEAPGPERRFDGGSSSRTRVEAPGQERHFDGGSSSRTRVEAPGPERSFDGGSSSRTRVEAPSPERRLDGGSSSCIRVEAPISVRRYLSGVAPFPEERFWYEAPLSPEERRCEDELDVENGRPIPQCRCRLVHQKSWHDSPPPTKRRRLHSFTERWNARRESNASLTGSGGSAGSGSRNFVSKTIDVLVGLVRKGPEATAENPAREQDRPSFQHFEGAGPPSKM